MTPQEQNTLCICGHLDCVVPFGLCHCGCGKKTTLAGANIPRLNHRKGLPTRFVKGHQSFTGRPDVSDEKTFIKDGDICRRVPLTRGQWAVVDESEFERINSNRWIALWCPKTKSFYAVRTVITKGKRICVRMHREVLYLHSGIVKKGDHKNCDTLDNRVRNIRRATDAQNCHNRRKARNNTSGYKGVSWHKGTGMWVARITVNGIRYGLGYFHTPEEAYAAYCAAAEIHHGEFKRVA